MKIVITRIEAEGTAAEARELLAGLHAPVVMEAAPVVEAPEVIDAVSASITPSQPAPPVPAPQPLSVVPDAVAVPVTPDTPVDLPHETDWISIPPDFLVWDPEGFTAHVARHPSNRDALWCGTKIKRHRDPELKPRKVAKPCGNCRRSIQTHNHQFETETA